MKSLDGPKMQEYFDREHYVSRTVAQLSRELSVFSITFRYEEKGHSPYGSLFLSLHPIVLRLLEKDPGTLRALLYRVDVPEEYLLEKPDSAHSQEAWLTESIIRRTLLKVITRERFGGGHA